MTKQYGIIGFPLSHSFSPAFFNRKFEQEQLDCHYAVFSIDTINQFSLLLEVRPDLQGLNVTIPYKTSVIPFLDHISISAKEIGAVNCIKIWNGQLYGFNTDHIGFAQSLKPLLDESIQSALVLGTGGSSKAICYALTQLKINYKTVSSSGKGDLSYDDLSEEIMARHQLIINTTPLGMFPQTEQCPDIPYSLLNESHLLFDLIYNPEQTLFLKKGRQQNCRIKNGLEMLVLQAEAGWKIWDQDAFEETTITLK